MADPYKVLGVSPDTPEEEITKAYRRLAKKYHPDANPGNKQAETMMKEINAAYAQIKDGQGEPSYGPQNSGYRQAGPSANGWSSPFGSDWEEIFFSYGGQYRRYESDEARLRAVRSFLEAGQYYQALRILAEVNQRDAPWFFYSAVANAYAGNRVTALGHAGEAVRLDPGNQDYRALLDRLQQAARTYDRSVTGFGFNLSTVGRAVVGLWVAQIVMFFCCRMCF